MSLNIVFLCDEYPPYMNGGIGTFTKENAESLVKEGHTVSVVGFYNDLETDEKLEVNGVYLYRLSNMRESSFIKQRLKIYSVIKNINSIDILECQEHSGYLAFWPKQNYPIVVRLHGSITYFTQHRDKTSLLYWFWYLLEKSTLKKATAILSVSKYTAEKTKKIFNLKKEISVIYNGVKCPDIIKTDYKQKNALNVIFAGTLHEKKGIFSLAAAWKKVILKYPDAQLNIVGRDTWDCLKMMEDIIGSKNSIKFYGFIKKSDLESLYMKMDVAIFPSYMEAFALAPMEAMAMGLPVIYSSLCSGKELINDSSIGILVDPNDIETIEKAILKFASMTTTERKRIGELGRKRIYKNFNVEAQAKKNHQAYLELVKHND